MFVARLVASLLGGVGEGWGILALEMGALIAVRHWESYLTSLNLRKLIFYLRMITGYTS